MLTCVAVVSSFSLLHRIPLCDPITTDPFYISGPLGYFQYFFAVSLLICAFLCMLLGSTCTWNSLRYKPRSGIAESWSMYIFNCTQLICRSCQIVFQDCISVSLSQQSKSSGSISVDFWDLHIEVFFCDCDLSLLNQKFLLYIFVTLLWGSQIQNNIGDISFKKTI